MCNAHFKFLMWMAALIGLLILFDAHSAGTGTASERPCGSFNVARLDADIKNGFFDDNAELAKTVLSQLAWQLKCERAIRNVNAPRRHS